ncbi:hypothetical protein Sme01_09590 [Sphaerisporangium melleum]|uniref:Uncharacterized protein n=1 Tax=Sphaerisporangium melleum TaxID=321316 RepID=A0A917VEE3_9ACTN|nr:hypothetical protein [Sphaerisporangium melleum]GGK67375.1 hypothetical protein GCM10007964_08020 [Sphaerisporangium melleum]GII68483.1 hypothetical protein Sme01_09590 [Sphaerisporangium melleum]
MSDSPPLGGSTKSPHPGTLTIAPHPPAAVLPPVRRGRRLVTSGWVPGTAVAALAVTVLHHYGTSLTDLATFFGYLTVCVLVPGTLLVRALTCRALTARTLVEDAALGLTFGYAVEILTYIAARAAGAPLLVLVWPAATYTAFLVVPSLRRHWRGAGRRGQAPAWWPWFLSLMMTYMLGTSALMFFRSAAVTWPAAGTAHLDNAYNLSLLTEIKHHFPPHVPQVAGEPLYYHWFMYAHYAASSWITGIEPLILLFRLGTLPMYAAFLVLVAMVARRIIGSWAGAALSVALMVFAAMPSLYVNANGLLIWTGIHVVPWSTPTTTFGALLFAALLLPLARILARPGAGAGAWTMLVVLLLVVMGGKAIYIPLLLAGLTVFVAVEVVRRRRPPRRALAVMAVCLVFLAFAQIVLYGRVRQGVALDPMSIARSSWAMLTGGDVSRAPLPAIAGITVLYLVGWAFMWCGVAGLVADRRLALRVPAVLALGMAVPGFALSLLLGSPISFNQVYFLVAVMPYLAMLSVLGYLTLARRQRVTPAFAIAAAGAGVAVAYLIRFVCGVRVPLRPGEPEYLLYLPYLALAAIAAAAVPAFALIRRRPRPWALLIAAAVGVGPIAAWATRTELTVFHGLDRGMYTHIRTEPDAVPRGLLAAARWLRDHSRPDDLVATNDQCRWGHENPCDSREFWTAALSERRMLIAGWGYTPTALDRSKTNAGFEGVPFWDQERLRANNVVFTAPSADAVAVLRDRYGVRWLLSDERHVPPGARIADFAALRFRSGDCAVYQVPAAGGPSPRPATG